MRKRRAPIFVAALVVSMTAGPAATAARFCLPVKSTIRKEIADADVAVIARPLLEQSKNPLGEAVEVVSIVKPLSGKSISSGDRFFVETIGLEESQPILLTGKVKNGDRSEIEWSDQTSVTDASLDYISQMATLRNDDLRALCYCIGLIESNDSVIVHDVQKELCDASLQNLQAAKRLMPKSKLEALFLSEKTPLGRAAVYGHMLGVCGDKNTEQLLRKQILGTGRASRSERTLLGYLLLSGEEGLATLNQRYFSNEALEFPEVYPALYALCRLSEDLPGHIEKQKLYEAIYPLLERKSLADVAIGRLAYLRDWTVQDRLATTYGNLPPEQDWIRKAIVDYMKKCAAEFPTDETAKAPVHSTKAREFLRRIESSSPKTR